MTITGKIRWDEGPLSVSNENANTELRYVLYSDDPANDDRGSALAWMIDNAPDDLFGLIQDKAEVNERLADTPTEAIWDGVVSYKDRGKRKPKELESKDPPDNEVRVHVRSSTGARLRRTSSLAHLDHIYNGDSDWNWSAKEYKTLLNLKADGDDESSATFSAQGIDVTAGSVELVVETVLPHNVFYGNYLINACLQAGKNACNETDWRGFPFRCLKLINIDANQRGGDEGDTDLNTEPWEVTYTMQYAPVTTIAELMAGRPPGLSNIAGAAGTWDRDKQGWEYLDYLYVNDWPDTLPSGARLIIPQAKRGALHQIYPDYEFANLYI
jgi:hypothetical protein